MQPKCVDNYVYSSSDLNVEMFSSNEEELNFYLNDHSIVRFEYNTFENFTHIARGGCGEVKRAYMEALGKYVALKSLYDEKNNEFYKKFVREVNECFNIC